MIEDLGHPRAGSHLVPLVRCLAVTSGPVLEVGVGVWSTPFLRRYCGAAGRRLESVEADPRWAAEFGAKLVDYDDELPRLAEQAWSVVLIDHWPATRRLTDAARFWRADHILVHDAAKVMRGSTPPPGAIVLNDTLIASYACAS